MKKKCQFRYLLLAVLSFSCGMVSAQADGSISANPTLGNESIKVIDKRYGVLGSTITTEIKCTRPDLEGKNCTDTTFYRIYKGNETQIKLEDNFDKDFKPERGVDQILKYKVKFTFKDEDEKNSNDSIVTIECKDSFIFSIYDFEGYSFSFEQQPEGSAKNTYAGREDPVRYSVNLKPDSTSILPLYRIVWKINQADSVQSGDTYDFDLSSLTDTTKIDYTFTAQVRFYLTNPDSIWFEGGSLTSDILSVYLNPDKVDFSNSGIYSYPEKDGKKNYSHTGLEDRARKYKINIENAIGDGNNYGNWIYDWEVTKDDDKKAVYTSQNSEIEIPDNVEKGRYKTTLTLKCVNPEDVNDTWKEVRNAYNFEEYVVYERPYWSTNDNVYFSPDHDKNVYAMYVGQKYDTKNLYTCVGGYKDGWTCYLDGSEITEFNPKEAKNRDLNLKAINKAPDGVETWFEDSLKVTFQVYEMPSEDIDVAVINEKGEITKIDDPVNIDIIEGEKVSFKIKCQGGGGREFWDVKPSKDKKYTINPVDEFGYELKGESMPANDFSSETYDVTFTVTNTPRNIIKGLQYNNVYEDYKVNQWLDLSVTFLDTLISNSTTGSGNEKHYVIETYEGLTEEIKLKTIGGISAGNWKADWICNDDPVYTIPELKGNTVLDWDENNKPIYNNLITATFEGDRSLIANGTEARIYHYTVNAYYNNYGKENAKPKTTFNVDIKTYPKPEMLSFTGTSLKTREGKDITINNMHNEVNVDCYKGDELLLKFDNSALNQEGPAKWKYSFDGGANKNDFNDDGIISFKQEENENKKLNIYYIHSGNYYASNETWFESDEFLININRYQIPKLKAELKDSIESVKWGEENRVDIYAGGSEYNNVNLKYSSDNEGYPKGWECTWTVDEDTRTTADPSYSYVPMVTSNDVYEEKEISVHIINKIADENVGLDTTFVYPIRVWRKAEFAESFTLTDSIQNRNLDDNQLAIRRGNKITGLVEPIKYGYISNNDKPSHVYAWFEDGVSISDSTKWEREAPFGDAEVNVKATEEHTYKIEMKNYGPSGNVWDGKEVLEKAVTVYNKPATPTSIVQKGSGTSRTMIANVSDQDLEGGEYYLVFGYTDNAGVDHDFASQQQLNPGQVRWSTPFANQQQMENAYVYALWKYGNAEITSGKCMLTGIDEDYDSSTYNSSTRAAIVEDNPNAIDIASENSGVLGVYNLNGTKIGTSLSDLKPGLYIVEYADGVTNKIVVK